MLRVRTKKKKLERKTCFIDRKLYISGSTKAHIEQHLGRIYKFIDGTDDLKMTCKNVILERLVMVQPESSSPAPTFFFFFFLSPRIHDSRLSQGRGWGARGRHNPECGCVFNACFYVVLLSLQVRS